MLLVAQLSSAALVPHAAQRGVSRRSALLGGAALVAVPSLPAYADRGKDLYQEDRAILSGGGAVNEALGQSVPVFDDDGKLIDAKGYEEVATRRAVKQGQASVQVPKPWVQAADGVWADPVTGRVASSLAMTSTPSSLKSITDAGKPENLKVVSVLGLNPELKRADMVAAAVEKRDGVVYARSSNLTHPRGHADAFTHTH
jgi:hypothetical protein